MSETVQGVFVSVGILLLLAFLIYIRTRYTGPQSQRKALEKLPFTQLAENGFERKSDHLTAVITDYTVVVRYEFVPHPHIRIDVLFDPNYLDRVYNDDEIKQLNKRHYKYRSKTGPENHFFPCFAMTEMYIRDMHLKLRTADEIVDKAKQLIEILRSEGLKPMGLREKESV